VAGGGIVTDVVSVLLGIAERTQRRGAMTDKGVVQLVRYLEGRQVSIALADGSRIDDCELVSGGHGVEQLWLYTNGADVFLPLEHVTDLWEVVPTGPARA
jgi:hypothetical protein